MSALARLAPRRLPDKFAASTLFAPDATCCATGTRPARAFFVPFPPSAPEHRAERDQEFFSSAFGMALARPLAHPRGAPNSTGCLISLCHLRLRAPSRVIQLICSSALFRSPVRAPPPSERPNPSNSRVGRHAREVGMCAPLNLYRASACSASGSCAGLIRTLSAYSRLEARACATRADELLMCVELLLT